MCFCFDGTDMVAALRPDSCRERLRNADIPDGRPASVRGRPFAPGSMEHADPKRLRPLPLGHIAAGIFPHGQPY
jgi:hypothetical protein